MQIAALSQSGMTIIPAERQRSVTLRHPSLHAAREHATMGLMSWRLLEQLENHAREQPDSIAVQQVWPASGESLTWQQLLTEVKRLSEQFSAMLPAGAVVLLCCGNRPQYIAAYLGVLHAKMTVFPVAPDLTEAELLDAAKRSAAAGAIALVPWQFLSEEHFQQRSDFGQMGNGIIFTKPKWPVREAASGSMLLLSSGTTATPKIVLRNAASLDAVAEQMVQAVGFTKEDRVLAAVPLCHSYGVEHGLLAPIWAGSRVHLCDGFDLHAAIDQLTSGGVTIFPGVPFMYEMLVAGGADRIEFPKLRLAYSAGAPLPRVLFDSFEKRFGVRVTQLYGATEIGSVTFNSPEQEPFDPASVGRPMRGVQIAILDQDNPDLKHQFPDGTEGHVAITAASMMSGYVDDAAPLLDGFFLTGDLGRLDDGNLTITGRIKLLIDVGGRKVNPLEVERVIETHPAVGACIVVPMPVSQTLHRLKAIVTPARKGVFIDPRELRELARRQLSSYKVPRVIEVRDTLPRSPAGKILRHLVQA